MYKTRPFLIGIFLLAGFFVLALSCKSGTSLHSDQEKNISDKTTVLYLVRHAEKEDDGTKDPPLTTAGINRAKKLSDMLDHENIKHIFSTDYNRTQQTAQPLASALQLKIQSYDPGDFKDLLVFIQNNQGSNMLIVGHSNTTPTLCNAILEEEKFEQIEESDYGNLFKITLQGRDKRSEHIRF